MGAPSPRCRRGFTLLEIMVVLVVLSILLAAFSSSMLEGLRSFGIVTTTSHLENDVNEMMDRIVDSLRQASTASPNWSLSTSSVTYNPCLGSSSGTVTWGSALTITTIPGPDTVDQRVLVVKDSTGAVQQTWGHFVQTGGLQFTLNGKNLTISLTLQNQSGDFRFNEITAASDTTVVSLRN